MSLVSLKQDQGGDPHRASLLVVCKRTSPNLINQSADCSPTLKCKSLPVQQNDRDESQGLSSAAKKSEEGMARTWGCRKHTLVKGRSSSVMRNKRDDV